MCLLSFPLSVVAINLELISFLLPLPGLCDLWADSAAHASTQPRWHCLGLWPSPDDECHFRRQGQRVTLHCYYCFYRFSLFSDGLLLTSCVCVCVCVCVVGPRQIARRADWLYEGSRLCSWSSVQVLKPSHCAVLSQCYVLLYCK